jgi:hypothetical protein
MHISPILCILLLEDIFSEGEIGYGMEISEMGFGSRTLYNTMQACALVTDSTGFLCFFLKNWTSYGPKHGVYSTELYPDLALAENLNISLGK